MLQSWWVQGHTYLTDFLPQSWSPAQGRDAHASSFEISWVRLEEYRKTLLSLSNSKQGVFSNRVCTDKKMFNLHGRHPIVLTFRTIGCKTLSKHLPDTYYRDSVGGIAINQNIPRRQSCWWSPGKMTWSPVVLSLFLQIKTQSNQEGEKLYWVLACFPD